MATPLINPGQYGSTHTWDAVFSDEFETDGPPDPTIWRAETLREDSNGSLNQAAQHVVNTYGYDRDGNLDPNQFAAGKRHAAWYDERRSEVQYVQDGNLVLGGFVDHINDPTITQTYFDPGENQEIDLRNVKAYASWLDTASIIYNNTTNRQELDPASPRQYFRYGYFEFRVSFAQMITPGFRFSGWLLPAINADGSATVGQTYNDSPTPTPADGLECDIWEYEPAPNADQLLLMKNIGGGAGSDPATDATLFGADLRQGYHTIGLLWEPDRMVWYLNGQETKRDEAAVMQVAAAIYLTREMNTGVKHASAGDYDPLQDPASNPPFIQADPGLYARNVGAFLDNIAVDEALCAYVRVWQNPAIAGNIVSPFNTGVQPEGRPAGSQPEALSIEGLASDDDWEITSQSTQTGTPEVPEIPETEYPPSQNLPIVGAATRSTVYIDRPPAIVKDQEFDMAVRVPQGKSIDDYTYQWTHNYGADAEFIGAVNEYEVTAVVFRDVSVDTSAAFNCDVNAKDGSVIPLAEAAAGTVINVTPPIISGFVTEGEIITIVPDTWSGPSSVVRTLLRNGNFAGNIVNNTYTVVALDEGRSLQVRAVETESNVEALSNTLSLPLPPVPVPLANPVISGGTNPGDVVSITPGVWTESPQISRSLIADGVLTREIIGTSFTILPGEGSAFQIREDEGISNSFLLSNVLT